MPVAGPFVELVADVRFRIALRQAARAGGAQRFRRIEAALAEVLRLDVADVQEAVAAHAEIDERRLDARLQVDDDAFVNVSYVIVLSSPFYIQFFEGSIFNDGDPAFFRLRDVDQHFLFHLVAFLFGNTDQDAFAGGVGHGDRGGRRRLPPGYATKPSVFPGNLLRPLLDNHDFTVLLHSFQA